MEDPPYARIAAELRRRITAGELAPGDRVPSTRQLVRDWNVALATATRALAVLRDQGLVEAVPRVGTVVAGARPVTPAPGRALRRDAVVAAAVAIADRDGIDAVSMRGVAAQLGVPTMSLYGHVHGKDDLVLLMIDATFAEDPFPDPAPDGWRARLEVAARLQWASYRRHPWLAQVVTLTRPQQVENLYRHGEWILSALEDSPLDSTGRLDVHLTLCNYVRGIAANLPEEGEPVPDVDAEFMGRFPAIARIGDYPFDLDRIFAFGLKGLLDGFAPLVAARSAPDP